MNTNSNRTALRILLFVIGVLVVLVIVALVTRKSPEELTPSSPAPAAVQTVADSNSQSPASEVPASASSPTDAGETNVIVTARVAERVRPTPQPTFDPEKQPRKLQVLDFRDVTSLPEGYQLDNVVLTDKGFQLPPPKPGDEDAPRFGTIKSPDFKLDFPSNAVTPVWLEDLPKGTNLFVEIQMSPDGKTWSIWHPIEPDEDAGTIPANFPDGRPNPNAGHTPGGVLFWGNREFQYYRFRVTFSSEAKDTPTLSTFHLYYQDSTLGQGHIAQLQGDEIQR